MNTPTNMAPSREALMKALEFAAPMNNGATFSDAQVNGFLVQLRLVAQLERDLVDLKATNQRQHEAFVMEQGLRNAAQHEAAGLRARIKRRDRQPASVRGLVKRLAEDHPGRSISITLGPVEA